MRVLVTGSRDWADQNMVWSVLNGLYQEYVVGYNLLYLAPFVLIEGEARGADMMAAGWAKSSPLHGECVTEPYPLLQDDGYTATYEECPVFLKPYPADWTKYGNGAGPIRNRQMLQDGKPTLVVAFKDGFDCTLNKGGTEDMVKVAKDADVPVWLMAHA